MPVSMNNTTLTFNDGTTQTTAFTGGGGIQTGVQRFGSSGTFTANTSKVFVVCVGGGGGGGAGTAGGNAPGGGVGGAGAVGAGYYTVTPGANYAVTVGNQGNGGGSGGGACNAPGGNPGNASSFGNLLTANGGGGGGGASGCNSNGAPGANGNAPLAQASTIGTNIAGAFGMGNGGYPGNGGYADAGGTNGSPGVVLVYY